VATTFKEKLAALGIIFCSFSEAVQKHAVLVRRYLGSVVPYSDNFFAALNAAVFSDGSFCYIPKGVRCDALGLEPEYIRKKLKHWTSSPPGQRADKEVVSSQRINRRGFATQQKVTDQAP